MRAEGGRVPDVGSPRWVASTIRQPKSGLEPYAEAVRGHALLVASILAVVLVASVAWLAMRVPQYRASAEIFVTPLPPETVALVGLPLIQDLRDPTRTIQTAAALVDSNAAAARTAQILGGNWTPRKVERAITVEPKGETNILEVNAVAESPTLAAIVANTYSSSTLAVRRATLQRLARKAIPDVQARLRQVTPTSPGASELQSALNRLQSLADGRDPTLSLSQMAIPPTSPLGAPGWLVVVLACLAGSVLGVGAAVAIDRITPPRITSEDELVEVFPLPILARLPILPRKQRGLLSLEVHPEAREALRSVQVQLDLQGDRPRTVMITSPSPADGKTTTALAFAVAIADAGARVILIDTDVRRLPIRTGLGAERETVSAVHAGSRHRSGAQSSDLRTSLRPLLRRVIGHPNLQLLDAMDVGFDSADPRSRGRFADLVRAASSEADYVLLDTPPIGVISDALTLLDLVDDVLLVARIRATQRLHVEVARDLLARAGVSPAGYLVIGERTLGSYPYPLTPRAK